MPSGKHSLHCKGSSVCHSSGYHPEIDGQTEVVNRCLATYLCCFCSLQPKKWSFWLPWAEWSYNTAHHSATKLSPYEVVYGQPPPHLPVYEAGTTKLEMVEKSLKERNRMLSLLKANLAAAQN